MQIFLDIPLTSYHAYVVRLCASTNSYQLSERDLVRSLSYWSHKTLESNKSELNKGPVKVLYSCCKKRPWSTDTPVCPPPSGLQSRAFGPSSPILTDQLPLAMAPLDAS